MSAQVTIDQAGLDELLAALGRRGFELIGPTVRDGAIVYDEIGSCDDLPAGWTDEQDGGSYRLRRREDEALFGYAVGPQSWKRFLHPPELTLWRARRGADGELEVSEEAPEAPSYAFIGVRSCELHAIAIQDRVLMEGEFPDPFYRARREGAFIVAVNCTVAGGTCFCVSMETGPRAESGYDLALTEVIDSALEMSGKLVRVQYDFLTNVVHGADEVNDLSRGAWDFLAPYIAQADACVFSRDAYVPDVCRESGMTVAIVPPSIDGLSPKNQEMSRVQIEAILRHTGLLAEDRRDGAEAVFTRPVVDTARVERCCEVIGEAGRESVRASFLENRHTLQYVDLLGHLLAR
jgi:hypothetical protein